MSRRQKHADRRGSTAVTTQRPQFRVHRQETRPQRRFHKFGISLWAAKRGTAVRARAGKATNFSIKGNYHFRRLKDHELHHALQNERGAAKAGHKHEAQRDARNGGACGGPARTKTWT